MPSSSRLITLLVLLLAMILATSVLARRGHRHHNRHASRRHVDNVDNYAETLSEGCRGGKWVCPHFLYCYWACPPNSRSLSDGETPETVVVENRARRVTRGLKKQKIGSAIVYKKEDEMKQELKKQMSKF